MFTYFLYDFLARMGLAIFYNGVGMPGKSNKRVKCLFKHELFCVNSVLVKHTWVTALTTEGLHSPPAHVLHKHKQNTLPTSGDTTWEWGRGI